MAKLGIVVEEADETGFWIEMLSDCEIMPQAKLSHLADEAHQLTAIFTAARHTARENKQL